MAPFAQVINEFAVSSPKYFNDVPVDDVHNIQIHNFDLTLLDRSQMLQQEMARQSHTSPVLVVSPSFGYCFPTPPPSEERPRLNKSFNASKTPFAD
ncbi:unnamed protein product [Soboliphyme baturini]|uniref:Uncharacterized protein n=1 Tax=Soboliphyme baturini TaxID=241478 RepID=A0A183J477_9BILA|nr:unnamed protein product [Soboliphyme baturini]